MSTKRSFYSLLALFLLALTGCSRLQPVVLVDPQDDDLIIVNGCVVSACNYLAITRARHKLEPDYWAKVLLVRFEDHPAGHAYCVWETNGTIYGYDRNSGGFPIPIYTRDPRAIATVLAGELSKVLNENLKVESADFVEPHSEKLFAYSLSSQTKKPTPLLGTAPLPAGPLLLKKTPATLK